MTVNGLSQTDVRTCPRLLRDTIAGLKLEQPLTGAPASLRRLALTVDNGERRT
jgi:hypothetical protein